MRISPVDAVQRIFGAVVRGVIMRVDDSKRMQWIEARGTNGEYFTKIERPQQYGFSSVPVPPDQNGGSAAEVVVGFRDGNRAHPYVVSEGDRRSRPKNLKPGESKHYDDQGQNAHLARDGHYLTAKQHVLTAGDKPATTFELNEQLKGLAGRMAQAEHNLHGLFDVTSRFREIVQQSIPAVAEVAPILNQDPSGLPVMADAIAGKEMNYLQQQMQQALGKFLSPNLAGLAGLLGGVEAAITSLEGQIGQLLAQNPVVGQVDDLLDELSALQGSGNTPGTIAQMSTQLQGQIDALTQANPIVSTVAGLRQTLQGLVNQAGPGLNFLAPQQRLVQGLSKSMRIAP